MDCTNVEQQLINSWTTSAAENQHVDQLCLLVVTLIHRYICIYTYIYICVHVYIRVYMCIYVHKWIHIHTYLYMCIYVYVCVSVCMGPRPRRLTLKGSASCYYLSIIKSKIFIFRIEGEQPHQDFLFFYCFLTTRPQSNTTAGRVKAARRRVRFRPVGQKAIEKLKILVWLLAFKARNKYHFFAHARISSSIIHVWISFRSDFIFFKLVWLFQEFHNSYIELSNHHKAMLINTWTTCYFRST